MTIYRGFSEPPRLIEPARPRSRSEATEVPELRRKAAPTVEVVLGRSARDLIRDDLWGSTRTDGLEAGGFLFGRPTVSWQKTVEILDATETGNAERTSSWMKLDTDPWTRLEQAYARDEFDGRLLGLWHSHPSTRAGWPSDEDCISLLRVLDWHEQHGRHAAYSVGLIYAADERYGDSWAKPYLHAWVVRREGYSQTPICEPALIRERR